MNRRDQAYVRASVSSKEARERAQRIRRLRKASDRDSRIDPSLLALRRVQSLSDAIEIAEGLES